MTPQRIQLRLSKGWRMPPNTVKVDRTTRFGNPFIVSSQGKAIECVYWYGLLICGYHNYSVGIKCGKRQDAAYEALKAEKRDGWPTLKGKNLACWCRIGAPCHADLLLELANGRVPDLADFLADYGWKFVNGEPQRLAAA